jgi:ribosomal-protein-alanine acetyltransferase
MNIRRGRPEDISVILRLESEFAGLPPWSEQAYAAALDPQLADRIFLVGEIDGAVHACLVARFTLPECELERIFVSQLNHRRGLASRLLNAFFGAARERGIEQVHLEVRDSNIAARALYVKFGFQEIGRRENYYASPTEDAIVYSLRL